MSPKILKRWTWVRSRSDANTLYKWGGLEDQDPKCEFGFGPNIMQIHCKLRGLEEQDPRMWIWWFLRWTCANHLSWKYKKATADVQICCPKSFWKLTRVWSQSHANTLQVTWFGGSGSPRVNLAVVPTCKCIVNYVLCGSRIPKVQLSLVLKSCTCRSQKWIWVCPQSRGLWDEPV